MPKKKDYPKWFDPFNKPVAPIEPTKEYVTNLGKLLHNFDGDRILVKEIPKNTDYIDITYDIDYGCSISFFQAISTTQSNKRYDIELRQYLIRLREYETQAKEWGEWKYKWDGEERAEKMKHKQKLYDRLARELQNLRKELDD